MYKTNSLFPAGALSDQKNKAQPPSKNNQWGVGKWSEPLGQMQGWGGKPYTKVELLGL